MVERTPVVFALGEDRVPRQAGLRPFENQELEQRAVVAHWHAPFAVVIGDRERIARPAAAARLGRHTVSSSAIVSVSPATYVPPAPTTRHRFGRPSVGIATIPIACA